MAKKTATLTAVYQGNGGAESSRKDGWNSRDPDKVSLAYTIDSTWRNRAEFINGRKEILDS